MKPVIVTAATAPELALLARAAGGEPLPSCGHLQISVGKAGATDVILAVTGIGKVNASSAITALLNHYKPKLLINTGCGGAYAGMGLAVGDMAVATSEIYGDEGVLTPKGWEPLDIIGIPVVERGGKRYFNEFPLSATAADKAMRLAASMGTRLCPGKFVTVSTCSGAAARGEELCQRFGAVCENMEGAAIAHVALMYGVECLEIRGISNMAEDRDLSRWDISLALENSQRFVLEFIKAL